MIKDGIKNGTLQNLDFSKDLADAVEIYISAKAKKMTVREFLNQVDITDTTSSESKKIATIFFSK